MRFMLPILRRLAMALVLTTASGVVLAQAKDPAVEAKERFETGRRLYRLNNYDRAIEEWKAGYLVKADPVFLFNIAQAYREKKDFENALKFYENYLKDLPTATNRDAVEHRIAELREALKKRDEASHAPPTGPIEQDETSTPPKPGPTTHEPPLVTDSHADTVPARPGRGMKIAGIVTGAVGVALIGTSVAFALSARSAESDVQAAVDAGQRWTPELRDKDSSGRLSSTLSTVSLSVGIAAVVGGGVLYYLGARRSGTAARGEVSIVPQLAPSLAGLQVILTY